MKPVLGSEKAKIWQQQKLARHRLIARGRAGAPPIAAVFSHSGCLRDSADACVPRARDQSETRSCDSTRSRAALGAAIVGRRLR